MAKNSQARRGGRGESCTREDDEPRGWGPREALVRRFQDEYLAAHPKLPKARRAEAAEPQPSRSLPARVHDKPRRWMYPLQAAGDSTTRLVVGAGLRSLKRSLAQSNAALLMATCDFANDILDVNKADRVVERFPVDWQA